MTLCWQKTVDRMKSDPSGMPGNLMKTSRIIHFLRLFRPPLRRTQRNPHDPGSNSSQGVVRFFTVSRLFGQMTPCRSFDPAREVFEVAARIILE
jgi:hypothetical protein